MTASVLMSILALAMIDSLNPFTIASQAYLLGTPRPLPRSCAFLIGTYLTYLFGGFLFLLGWSSLIGQVLPLVPRWGLPVAEIVFGLGLIAFGVWSYRLSRAGASIAPPANLSLLAAFAFAVSSTIMDLTSALPYFAAINLVAVDAMTITDELIALSLYCLIYCAPLMLLIAVRMFCRDAISDLFFGRMRQGIDWAIAKLLPLLMLVTGIVLVIDGIRRISTMS